MTQDVGGKTNHPSSDDDRISQPEVARLLGNVTAMTLWRWRHDPTLNFPKPVLEIHGRNYYQRSDILSWKPPVTSKKLDARRRQRSQHP